MGTKKEEKYVTINTRKVGLESLLKRRVIQMKRVILEATDENILQSIKEQVGTRRNTEILEFIEALEQIEGNMFISLDARWGEGKTFYVRQIEKTLEYLTFKNFGKSEDISSDLASYFERAATRDKVLNNSYLPIYYNAWLYDNHNDPLLSLLLVIIKKSKNLVNTTLSTTIGEKIKNIISSIQCGIGFMGGSANVSMSGEGIVKAFEHKNIFEDIQLAEDIRGKVKEIFDEIIIEKAQKMVIFIDELDRCRPNYALEMLERIKHYFDDDRIIFVVSVNKEQLTHTISNYYGSGFDSTGYLNKFFDINAYLPPVDRKNQEFLSQYSNCRYLNEMVDALTSYYKLSFRDALIYKERMAILDAAETNRIISDESVKGLCASIFVPLIVILDMKDSEEKVRFNNGESKILEQIKDISAIKYLCGSLGWREALEERNEKGYAILEAVYQFAFHNVPDALNKVDLAISDIGRDFKDQCIKLSGVIKDNRNN